MVAYTVLPKPVNRRILFSVYSPLYGVLCPDYIKWAGIPEKVFPPLLDEQVEEGHGLLTKNTIVVTIRIEIYYFTEKKHISFNIRGSIYCGF